MLVEEAFTVRKQVPVDSNRGMIGQDNALLLDTHCCSAVPRLCSLR